VLVEERDDAQQLPPTVRRLVWRSQAEQIRWLREVVNRYRGNQLIRSKAIDIVFREYGCPPKAKFCQAVAIGRWVQTHITYVNESPETFASPVRTLTWRFADCDDYASLTCSMLESIGIPSQLVGMEWWRPAGGKMFRHIFARALVAGRRVPLDATLDQDVRRLPNPIAISIRRGDNPRILAL
jgi:hypothetical protein